MMRLALVQEVFAKKIKRYADGRSVGLAVGRMVSYKGFDIAIRALRNVENSVLIIVGDGPERPALQHLAEQEQVADRVWMPGHCDDDELAACFRLCDVFLFPSRTPNEAFGLVQVQAMACGKPVVNCQLPSGVPEVAVGGMHGITVPPESPSDFAAAWQTLVNSPEKSRALGESGRQRYRSEYRLLTMQARFRRLLHAIMSTRR